MKSYELTYIVSSEIGSDQADAIKKDIETFVQGCGGLVLASEKTTPPILAYPIKKKTSGFFTTLELQMAEDTVKELSQKVKKEHNVLRHSLTVKKPVKQMKQRRMRKPILADAKSGHIVFAGNQKTAIHKQPGKVELEDIDKKLDEILSE